MSCLPKDLQPSHAAPDPALQPSSDLQFILEMAKLRLIRPDLDPILTHRGVGYALRDDL